MKSNSSLRDALRRWRDLTKSNFSSILRGDFDTDPISSTMYQIVLMCLAECYELFLPTIQARDEKEHLPDNGIETYSDLTDNAIPLMIELEDGTFLVPMFSNEKEAVYFCEHSPAKNEHIKLISVIPAFISAFMHAHEDCACVAIDDDILGKKGFYLSQSFLSDFDESVRRVAEENGTPDGSDVSKWMS
jgi:hypothetical protein